MNYKEKLKARKEIEELLNSGEDLVSTEMSIIDNKTGETVYKEVDGEVEINKLESAKEKQLRLEREEQKRIAEEKQRIKKEKERKKLEKLKRRVERKIKVNNALNTINYLLGDGKSKPPKDKTLDDYLMPWEKELMEKEGYEPYQLDEEEEEIEDDDLYEKGEN
ncbi:MAG: hypothetical protein IJL74_03680 [Bacilli bacterium]|nr:hypothetical protein [Bacilli bacterium]